MTRYTPRPKLKKYNRPPSDKYEQHYCQNAYCPNKNLILRGNLIKKKFMYFCSKECLKDMQKRIPVNF